MDNWTKISLGKLGKTFSGLSGKSKEDFGSGKPYITYMNIFSNSKINPNMVDFVEVGENEKQNRVQYGDIFFTTSSETLKEVGMTSVLLNNDLDEVYLNSFCFGFRLFDFNTLLPEFAAYLLRSENVRHQISFNGQGSTRYNLSKGQLLKNVILNIPPTREQKAIVKVLSKIDENIEKTKTIIVKNERIKVGLIQDLLTKGIDEQGNIRSEETHKFKDSVIGKIPIEWEINNLNNLCDLIKDGTHLPPERVDLGIWLLGVGNINDGKLEIKDNDTKVSKAFYKIMHKYWNLKSGDVLLAIVGATIGKVTQVPENFPLFTLQRSVGVLRGNEKKLKNDFLRSYIETKTFQDMIWKEVNVTAQPGIYLNSLKTMLVPTPKISEQEKIIGVIKSYNDILGHNKEELQKLNSIKKGLMQDLLTGNVPVDTLIEQSASII